jgi:membrane protein
LKHFQSGDRHFNRPAPKSPPKIKQFLSAAKSLVSGRKRLYASSLAFKTLLAIVPALAICMAVLAADQFSSQREQLLNKIVDIIYPVDASNLDLDPGEQKSIQRLNQTAKLQIQGSIQRFAAHAGKVGLFGLLTFFVILLLLMRDVEHSFNILWGIGGKRAWPTQALRHGVFLVCAPLAAILLLTLEQWARSGHVFYPTLHHWIFDTALPYLLLGLLCAWMYVWIPNTKVRWRSALLAGAVTAFLIETSRRLVTWYALTIVSHSNIYGALWMFPVILLWFYVSWVIILLGAEAASLFQGRAEA